jgi:hypothetical protein
LISAVSQFDSINKTVSVSLVDFESTNDYLTSEISIGGKWSLSQYGGFPIETILITKFCRFAGCQSSDTGRDRRSIRSLPSSFFTSLQ